MRNTMSAKQLAANRANAQKSTGPKTINGKAASKMNALKHGIRSKEAVVHGRCIRESDDEFAALHQRFWDDWKPVGPTEEMLLDRIVTAHWRSQRALTAESGEIALSVDGNHHHRSTRPDRLPLQFATEVLSPMGDVARLMEESVAGFNYLKYMLGQVRVIRAGANVVGHSLASAINLDLVIAALAVGSHGDVHKLHSGAAAARDGMGPVGIDRRPLV
jgi:hypothetical protein